MCSWLSRPAVLITSLVAFGVGLGDDVQPASDRFGDPLPKGVKGIFGTRRFAHGAIVYASVFSPDGRFLASRSAGGNVSLWEVASGNLVKTFEDVNGGVRAIGFSNDGRQIAYSPADDQVAIVQWKTGEQLTKLSLDADDKVSRLEFTPVHNSLLVTSKKAVKLWDLSTKKLLRKFPATWYYALHHRNHLLATADGSKVYLWDIKNGQRIRSFDALQGSAKVMSFAFSPDGKRLAVGWMPDRRARRVPEDFKFAVIYDVESGRVVFEPDGHAERVRAVAFSPDGRWFASGSRETLKVWDLREKKLAATLIDYDPITPWLRFSTDGKWLAAAGIGDALVMWNTATWERKFDGHIHIIRDFALSPGGKSLTTIAGNDPIRTWETATTKQLQLTIEPGSYTNNVIYSKDGKQIISAHRNTLQVWDRFSGELIRTIEFGDGSFVDGLALSQNGELLAGPVDSTVRLWNVRTGATVHTFKPFGEERPRPSTNFESITFSPDGSLVAAGGGYGGGLIIVWDVTTKTELFRLRHNANRVYSLCFSPDGGLLLSTACKDVKARTGDTIQVWELASGKPVHSIETADGCVTCSGFLSGGRHFYTAGNRWDGGGGHVRFWDTKDGRELTKVKVSRYGVQDVAFLPGEKSYVTVGNSTFAVLRTSPKEIQNVEKREIAPDALADRWDDLRGDPAVANRALMDLVENENDAVNLLRERLARDQPDTKQVQRLIVQLDDDSFTVRDEARKMLIKHGPQIIPMLKQSLGKSKSAETRQAIRQIIASQKTYFIESPEQLRRMRAKRILMLIGNDEATQVMRMFLD